jgi:hypothetical protein
MALAPVAEGKPALSARKCLVKNTKYLARKRNMIENRHLVNMHRPPVKVNCDILVQNR